jgi:hypothetical protein
MLGTSAIFLAEAAECYVPVQGYSLSSSLRLGSCKEATKEYVAGDQASRID